MCLFKKEVLSYLNRDSLQFVGNPYLMTFDCETTGFSDKKHDLISLSARIIDFDLDTKEKIVLYARPKKDRWTEGARKAHGFSLREALAFPDPRKTAIQMLHFLKPFKSEDNLPLLFISHDTSGFDSRFFKAFFMNQMLIESYWKVFKDEYKLSTISMGRKLGIEKNGLKDWAERLKLELNHHEVESDENACFEVFKYILENTNVQQRLEV